MTRRRYSPAHDFWHPRVEGQIKHTIGRHPEWFDLPLKTSAKSDCIRSLAKRIVGEIIAASKCGDDTALHESNCVGQLSDADDARLSRRRGRRPKGIVAPLNLTWYDAEKVVPERGGTMPYLVTYRSGSGQRRVTTAVWAGQTKGWVFLVPRFKSGLTQNVLFWARFPEPHSEQPTKGRDNENG